MTNSKPHIVMIKIGLCVFLLLLTREGFTSQKHISPYSMEQYKVGNVYSVDPALDFARLYKTGNMFLKSHEFSLAVATFTDIINGKPGMALAYFKRGQAYRMLGIIDQGINDLSTFLQFEPNNAMAYASRGAMYYENQEVYRALSDLNKALELDYSDSKVHQDLGLVYTFLGQYNSAVRHFISAIAINPKSYKSFMNLAMAYYFNDKEQSALIVVSHALKLWPNDPDLLILKGTVLQILGQENQAQQLVEVALHPPSERKLLNTTFNPSVVVMRGMDGQMHFIKEYFNQGKWIILNIWGPKCTHCVSELPNLQSFHIKHKELDATVLGVAVDYPSFGYARVDDVNAVLKANQITYPNLLADASLVSQLSNEALVGTPTTLFFSPQGQLIGVKLGQLTPEFLSSFMQNGRLQ